MYLAWRFFRVFQRNSDLQHQAGLGICTYMYLYELHNYIRNFCISSYSSFPPILVIEQILDICRMVQSCSTLLYPPDRSDHLATLETPTKGKLISVGA